MRFPLSWNLLVVVLVVGLLLSANPLAVLLIVVFCHDFSKLLFIGGDKPA